MIDVYSVRRAGEQFRKEDSEVDFQCYYFHLYPCVGLTKTVMMMMMMMMMMMVMMMMMMMKGEEEGRGEEEEVIELFGLKYVDLDVRLFHAETLGKRE